MPMYRLTGTYYFPPDRGSPHGNEELFSEEFEAADDQKAREWVVQYKDDHVEIRHPRLVRIVAREKTSPIKL